MQIKADYLTKNLVNFAQAEGEQLNLIKGEILKGMVESIKENGMIMVNLKGRSIEAFTELVLTPGQELFLMVDEPQDGKTILRLATTQMMADRTNEKIAVNLNQMGLKTDDSTLVIAQKLIQHNLPVSRENIEAMVKITRDMGGMTPSTLELASTALAGGLKTDSETMSSLREFITNPVVVKAVIEEVIKTLEGQNGTLQTAASGQLDNDAGTTARMHAPQTEPTNAIISEPVKTQIADNSKQADSIKTTNNSAAAAEQPGAQPVQIKPDMPGKQAAAQSLITVDDAAVTIVIEDDPQDTAIKTVLSGTNLTNQPSDEQTALPSTVKPALEFNAPAVQGALNTGIGSAAKDIPTAKTLETLKLILPLLSLQGDAPEQIINDLKQHFSGNKEVIKALNVAEQIIQKDPEAVKEHPVLQKAVAQIQTAEKQLVGQAAFNSLDKPVIDSNLPGYYYYAVPVETGGQSRMVELKLYKDGKSRRPLDELNEVRVAVALETQNLGQVVFHVTWNRELGLTLQGAVESSQTKTVIENAISDLTDRLLEMGFPVRFAGMNVAAEREQLRPVLTDAKEQSRILGIDIKV